MLKRQTPNEKYEMLPWYVGDYTPRTPVVNFVTANEVLMNAKKAMVENGRIERISKMIESKSCIKKEDIPENKKKFVYGFKHIITDKIDIYISIGCELDEFYGNDKLFSFCYNKCNNKEIQMRNFKITGWSFMTLGKKKTFF